MVEQTRNGRRAPIVVAGIDVGGQGKGFHAVAISDGEYFDKFSSTSVGEVAQWCRSSVKATVIGIDAPSRWSLDGRARPAERDLMREHIWCFSTPTREKALRHHKNYFGWMIRGMEIYSELERTHPCFSDSSRETGRQQCFETFPHAITVAFGHGLISARNKRRDRGAVLEEAGIRTEALTNIDLRDAGLCALAAHYLAVGEPCRAYGEPATGLIIVPRKTPDQQIQS